nr:helix-turn-helix domain-containing protein [Streptomyces sp. UNOB3_S3]
MFADGQSNGLVAKQLRVSVRPVQRWRQAYEAGGEAALRSTGSAGRPKPSDELFVALEAELGKGPVAHGRTRSGPWRGSRP